MQLLIHFFMVCVKAIITSKTLYNTYITMQIVRFRHNIWSITLFWTSAVLLLSLSSCSSVNINDYANNQPKFVLEEFFNGKLTAHGIIKNRSGKVIRYFNADINAYWQDGIGTLDESFQFDDGEVQQRIWKLTPQNDGSYIGTASDVSRDAIITTAGNSVFLDYVLETPYKEGKLDIHIDDRMYRVSDTVVINESVMRKFGFRVGSITLAIVKQN